MPADGGDGMTPPVRLTEEPLSIARVELDAERQSVLINNLVIEEQEVFEYLSKAAPTEHTGLISRALRIGAVAMRDALVGANVDYVRKEFAALKEQWADTVADHFGPKGDVTKLINDTFGDDGDLQTKLAAFLAPDGQFAKVLEEFLGDDGVVTSLLGDHGEFQKRLDHFFGDKGQLRQQLDKTFGAKAGQLFDLLNHHNAHGPMGAFMADLRRMFDADVEGSPMYQIRMEMRQQHKELLVHLGIDTGRRAEAKRGHAKGGDHEDWVHDEVNGLLRFGDLAEAVGDSRGATRKTGDTLVTINPDDTAGIPQRIVVESKNRALHLRGSNTIFQEMDRAMANREAGFAIAAVHADHAKEEFMPLRYYAPNKIICVADEETGILALDVAYNLARTLMLIRQGSGATTLDHETVEATVRKVSAELQKFQTIYGQLTSIDRTVGEIRATLKGIRDSIDEDLRVLLERSDGRGS